MSAHPMHGTRPLSRALQLEVRGSGSSDICLWKVRPARDGWGNNGGHLFTGTRVQAEARAVRMGISSSEVSRA